MNNLSLPTLLSVLIFLLALGLVPSLLRAKKAPGSTMAWLILLFAIPYIGIPFYFLLGVRKLPNRLSRKEFLFASRKNEKHLDELSDIQRLLSVSHIPDPKNNRSIELLTTGEEAFARYMELINQAKKTIYISTFIFGDDPVGNALVNALTKKAASGVDVRLLLDSFGAVLIRHPSMLRFKRCGGRMAYFMPFFHMPFQGRTHLRNHRKLLIVDEEVAILGGMNLAEEYMGPGPDDKRWTDLAVQIEGFSVSDLTTIFLQDWDFAFKKITTQTPLEHNPISEEKGGWAQVIASGPDVAGDPIYDTLLSSIYASHEKVIIVTPYFIPDESLTKALELAAKRGVKVQVILPRKSNHLLADIARGSFIRTLEVAGVEFHFYSEMIHAKVVMIDHSLALLGSANFDMRSLLLNYELGVLIYDEPTLKKTKDWIDQCLLKTTQGHSTESFARHMLEGVGRLIGPYI